MPGGELIETLSRGFHPAYVLPVLAGLALAVLFPSGRTFTDPAVRRRYQGLQLATLIGALIGAKVAAIIGDLRWPIEPIESPVAIFATGRSITGGLLFGFLTAELLKPVFGHREPPNDRFAAVLPFSIAIGRVGCWFAGCCNGLPTESALGLPDEHGVLRHPTALFELAFHLVLGVVFVVLLRRGVLRGRLFAIHLLAYGVFRFGVEPLRDSREYLLSLSAYQLFALAMIACGVFGLVRRLPAPQTVSTTERSDDVRASTAAP
ncbi:prolipoprotein diacylglyceryl transferase [Sandaracinus amylolyticus]|uniref:Prolipoprotein diacylglyceryl transferase n=1 Tax=Sandaracinus amylolyticus TaxID=927083 RepID=A0A0F6W716_9BACT|nr:prolipoprotein diacylglyceryl transferase family protein [Sandaracinus amylolyticus]AKF09137.1 Prolipoprotein diacylglyceryl transferase [Sandaracinus amylolyticus]